MSAQTLLEQHLGRCLTALDVARYLQCDVSTVYRHCSQLGGVKVGSCYRFFEKHLITALSVHPEPLNPVQADCEPSPVLPISSPPSPKRRIRAKKRSSGDVDSNPHGLF